MTLYTAQWIQDRITAAQSAVVAIETAIEALVGGAQSYSLDTGQTRQTVTKADLGSLRLQLENAEERLDRWLRRQDGGGVYVGRPSF